MENYENTENYCPISLLPIFGKIFENLIYDDMYKRLCDSKILTPNQSRFCAGDSAINQLLAITHKIYCGFENAPCLKTRSVFFNFSKAFDRAWHDGLIFKLEAPMILKNLLTLMCNFLTNRKQRVCPTL